MILKLVCDKLKHTKLHWACLRQILAESQKTLDAVITMQHFRLWRVAVMISNKYWNLCANTLQHTEMRCIA